MILQSTQPMVQPSDSEQSPSEEAILKFPEISQEATEEREAQVDEDYFNSMQNLQISKRETVQTPSETSQAVMSGTEPTETADKEMESEEVEIPEELSAELAQNQELIEANRKAIEEEQEEVRMFEELCEGEPEAEESDPGPESEVQIIQLYTDSDAKEQKVPSDPDSQPSQDEQPGSRKEWEWKRPPSAAAHSTKAPKPSVIIDEGDRHAEVGTAKSGTEKRHSRETEWKDTRRRSHRSSGSRSSRQTET